MLEPISQIPEHISVLYEYSDKEGDIDFFMEPGEEYTIGTGFVLEEGDYVAKIVFVGSRPTASEFWSRIVSFHVSETSQKQTDSVDLDGKAKKSPL